MISLARHIELLLIEHDCVIVPGLGGFIANHADAQYTSKGENLFLPPYRTIGFNPQLQMNDGLLVQSYMMAYSTSYPLANLQMEKDLERMLFELDMKGEYVLEGIGVLKKTLNQNISFAPQQAGVLTPTLYGLYSYEMKSVKSLLKEREINKQLQVAAASMHVTSNPEQSKTTTSQRKDVVIRLNRHWLDFGISAAAAVLLFFCFSYPALKNTPGDADTVVATFTPSVEATLPSSSQPTHSVSKKNVMLTETTADMESSTKEKTEISTLESPSAGLTKKENSQDVETPAQAEVSTKKDANTKETTAKDPSSQYTIVLASFVSQENANRYIEKMAKEGYKEGRFVKKGNTSRIIYSTYKSESEAQNALMSLRKQRSEFAEAWVLAL